jgi:hypothetical protein
LTSILRCDMEDYPADDTEEDIDKVTTAGDQIAGWQRRCDDRAAEVI